MGPITGAIVDLLANLSGRGVAAFSLCCNALFSALWNAMGVGPKALVFSPQ
jgi:hypothetical protein